MIFQANKRASSTDFFAAGAILAAAPALFVPLLPLGWADSLPPDSGSFLGACDVDADEVVSAHSILHPSLAVLVSSQQTAQSLISSDQVLVINC